MSDLPAKHYLDIYRRRVRCAEEGITHPAPQVVAGARRLVSGLSVLPPETPVRLELHSDHSRFLVAATGEVIAEIDFPAS